MHLPRGKEKKAKEILKKERVKSVEKAVFKATYATTGRWIEMGDAFLPKERKKDLDTPDATAHI